MGFVTVTVTDHINGDDGQPRWVVRSDFAQAGSARAFCIGYHVTLASPGTGVLAPPVPLLTADHLARLRTRALERAPVVADVARRIIAREEAPRPGAKPRLTLRERLLLLSDLESAPADTRQSMVARRHGVSSGYLRDVIRWGRSRSSGAELFTQAGIHGPHGAVTDVGRHILSLTEGR